MSVQATHGVDQLYQALIGYSIGQRYFLPSYYTRSSASYNRSCNKDTEERLKANRRWCNRLDFAVAFCPIPVSSRQFSLTDLFLSHSQGTRRYLRSSSNFILHFYFFFYCICRASINYNQDYLYYLRLLSCASIILLLYI